MIVHVYYATCAMMHNKTVIVREVCKGCTLALDKFYSYKSKYVIDIY